jgi:hypothetical protein
MLLQTEVVSEEYKVYVPLLATHPATAKMTGSSSGNPVGDQYS